MNNLIALVATEAAEAAKQTDGSLEDKLRAAMRKGYRHWMVTDENDQLMGALEGAARVLPDEDVERIKAELRLFQALGAATAGVPVDFGALLPDEDDEDRPEPIGIRKLWDEIKAENPVR